MSGDPNYLQMLSRIHSQPKDPRTDKWLAWQRQIDRDINGGGVLSDEVPFNMPMAQLEQFSANNPSLIASGQPLAPSQYEAWQRQQALNDILSRSRGSRLGQTRMAQKSGEDARFAADRSFIDRAPVPADISPYGQTPGSAGFNIVNWLRGNMFATDY